MKSISVFILCTFFFTQVSLGQQQTDQNKWNWEKEWVPISLIGAGSLLLLTNIDAVIQENVPKTNTASDDFMLWLPMSGLYGWDVFNVPTANNAFVQTKFFGAASLSNAIVILAIKRISDRKRPDGKSYAFPSGHTSQAFVSATVFWHELKDSKPILALSGYAIAATTGILRITNNRHWLTDVVVGAGFGILVTDLIYALEPLKNWDGIRLGKTSLKPQIGQLGEATLASIRIQF